MTEPPQPDGRPGIKAGIRLLRSAAGALDLVAACLLTLLAGLAYITLPDGSALRVALALAALFLAPGYLLIEAVAETGVSHGRRIVRAGIALGVSPAAVGLLALATAVLPGGFRPASIVAIVTVACFALASVAFWRRHRAAAHPKLMPATAAAT